MTPTVYVVSLCTAQTKAGRTYGIAATNDGQVALEDFGIHVLPDVTSSNGKGSTGPFTLATSIRRFVAFLVCDTLLNVLDPDLESSISLRPCSVSRFRRSAAGTDTYFPKISCPVFLTTKRTLFFFAKAMPVASSSGSVALIVYTGAWPRVHFPGVSPELRSTGGHESSVG
jgi:hypothetical protein